MGGGASKPRSLTAKDARPGELLYPPIELRQAPLASIATNAVKTTEFGLDDLEVISIIGCGGFAKVECVKLRQSCGAWPEGAPFALKTMSKAYILKQGMESAAVSEILVWSACKSPFIATCYTAWSSPEHIHLVSEILLGGELYATYNRESLYGNAKCAQFYTACVSLALLHLHGMSIICRGVKPEDVVLDASGYAKLVDMGFAKRLANHGEQSFTPCGTPDYFSPEVIASVGHGVANDWWAVGILTFELLAGAAPFASNTPQEIYHKVNAGIQKVTFPSAVQEAPGASEMIKALCARKPSQRLPMRKDGWKAFRDHTFFSDLDWTALENRSLSAPFVPTVSGPDDVSNFKTPDKEDLPRNFPRPGGKETQKVDELLKLVVA
jgi:serine/threonine protein kinase